MKKQITSISAVQTAKVFAVLSLVTALPFWLLMAISMIAIQGPKPPLFGAMFFFMPILYAIFGFVFVVVGAWVYNIVVKYTGGIEFTTVEVADDA